MATGRGRCSSRRSGRAVPGRPCSRAARPPRPPGGCSRSSSGPSGMTTTSSYAGSTRPKASLSRATRRCFGAAVGIGSGSIRSAGAVRGSSEGSGSSTSAAVKKSRVRVHTAAIGVPVKISRPSTTRPETHDGGADRRDHAGEGMRGRGAEHAAGARHGVVAVGRRGSSAEERQRPERAGDQDAEPDEHPDPVLASGVAEQHDPPVRADQREHVRGDPERAPRQPREEAPDRAGGSEPDAEHAEERDDHQEDAQRVPRMRRQDLPDRRLRRLLRLGGRALRGRSRGGLPGALSPSRLATTSAARGKSSSAPTPP